MARRHSTRPGDLESLFVRLEELALAGSAADEFEEVWLLLVAKLWDERCGRRPRLRATGQPARTGALMRALLDEAGRAWPGLLEPGAAPSLAPGQLEACVAVLAARPQVGGASLRALDGFFETLVARAAKGAKGQFFTPRHVIELCVRLVRPRPGERVLDPACGSGGFLVQTLEHLRREHPELPVAGLAAGLWGCDVDPRATRVAAALLTLAAGPGLAHVLQLNALLRGPAGAAPTLEAALGGGRRGGVDVILTNPPFAGDVRDPALLAGYETARGRGRVERDVLFVERCVELLRPGGRLAIVLPHNKLGAAAHAPLRAWLLARCRVVAVVALGRHTFLPHTHQKAAVLFAEKRRGPAGAVGQEPIFFAVSEREGKDSAGRPLLRPGHDPDAPAWEALDHDLAEVSGAFDAFRRRERVWSEA